MSLLKDRIIVVTGAGRGLGRAFAEDCCRQGAEVVIAEKNIECSIKGQTIELTSNEISKLDDYETGAYKREEVELPDGIKAWIYLNKNSK